MRRENESVTASDRVNERTDRNGRSLSVMMRGSAQPSGGISFVLGRPICGDTTTLVGLRRWRPMALAGVRPARCVTGGLGE